MLIIVCGGYALAYLLFDSVANDAQHLSDNEEKMREYGSCAIAGLTTIFLFLIIFARNRIRIAIQVGFTLISFWKRC